MAPEYSPGRHHDEANNPNWGVYRGQNRSVDSQIEDPNALPEEVYPELTNLIPNRVVIEMVDYPSPQELLATMEERGIRVGDGARLIIEAADLSNHNLLKYAAIKLVTPQDLKVEQIEQHGALEYAESNGYQLCPAIVGPLLALQHRSYAEVPVIIGMKPVSIRQDGQPSLSVFEVDYKGGKATLYSSPGGPNYLAGSNSVFAFLEKMSDIREELKKDQ